MTGTGFTEWFTDATDAGKLFGQSPRKIAEMAWQAGYADRETAEVPPEAPWDELTAIFPADYGRQTLKPYDLPVPPEVDWREVAADGANWMREIGRRAQSALDSRPVEPFSGRTDPDYELPALGSPGQEAYDRHFGAPGPVPAIPGLNGEPGEDEPYDDEEF